MQIRKISLAVVISLGLLPFAMQAQQKNSTIVNKANKEYNELRYVSAIELCKQILKKEPENIVAKEMMADSYRKIKDYANAAYWYTELSTVTPIKPVWALQYAEVLANQKKYAESEKWYQKYLTLISTDRRASAFVKAYPNLITLLTDEGSVKVNYLNINTAYSEYSPAFYKDGLIFSSNRNRYDVTRNIFEWDQTPFSDLYHVKQLIDIKPVNTDSLLAVIRREPVRLKKLYKVNDDDTRPTSNDTKVLGNLSLVYKRDTIGQFLGLNQTAQQVPGKVNSKYHEGPAVVLSNGSLMFTRNNLINGKTATSRDGINKLKIYTATGDNWENITSFPFNNDEYSVGHPAVNKAGTLLIFASDMPGGNGGIDLYYSKRNSPTADWSTPVNMGPNVNTEGDELFPSISNDQTLFFASTGHPGLGGLDIFQVTLKGENAIGAVVNLGAPINSSVDDFGLIKKGNEQMGYFTSNRRGSDDIYSFEGEKKKEIEKIIITLVGRVLNKETNLPIANALVSLLAPNGNPLNVKTDASGNFKFNLIENTNYLLTSEKAGFMKASENVTTNGITKSQELKKDLYMSEIIIGKTIRIDNIFYDFDKSNIRTDAALELDKLVKVLKENPTIWIELGSHTDSRGNDVYNQKLSQNRANAAVAYIISQGINADRIIAKGYGETMLVNECSNGVKCSDEAHQLNRRTEFKIIKQ